MTPDTRKFLTLIAIGLVLFAILVTDTHRTAIASVWPYIEAFADYQGK
jgi:hypothetical protein